jgi:hypothetical protein
MITEITLIISIIAIMLIDSIFNIYLIVSAAIYTIHVVLFNIFLAYVSGPPVRSLLTLVQDLMTRVTV